MEVQEAEIDAMTTHTGTSETAAVAGTVALVLGIPFTAAVAYTYVLSLGVLIGLVGLVAFVALVTALG